MAALLVVLLWAAIYLPRLGYLEFQGEEGRRALPAVNMLESGNWVVPELAGEAYHKKPPGINWLVAGSFALTGVWNEWTARLPSVLFVLAFALMVVVLRGPWLSVPARLAAAAVYLTNIAMMEKGRLIEIEAVYVSLTGMALVWWLDAWSRGAPRWSLWLVPALLLALASLVKAPILLLVFYPTVIAVAFHERRARELLTVEHALAVLLVGGVFLGWFALAKTQAPGAAMDRTMTAEVLNRLRISLADLPVWGTNILRALLDFFPWILFVPLLWVRPLTRHVPQRWTSLFKACRLGMVIGFVLLKMTPTMVPRYSMPVFPLASILVGWLMAEQTAALPSDRAWKWLLVGFLPLLCVASVGGLIYFGPDLVSGLILAATLAATLAIMPRLLRVRGGGAPLVVITALACGLAMLQYVAYGMPVRHGQQKHRPTAQVIDHAVPEGATLCAYRVDVPSLIFYIRHPIRFAQEPHEIPPRTRYLLIEQPYLELPAIRSRLSGVRLVHDVDDRVLTDLQLMAVSSVTHPAPPVP